jgi:hypothetical protein
MSFVKESIIVRPMLALNLVCFPDDEAEELARRIRNAGDEYAES